MLIVLGNMHVSHYFYARYWYRQNAKKIEERLQDKINHIFPKERYEVSLTGKAYVFEKGTHYLIDNLVQSLIFAIVLISLLMAYMFRSFKMIIVSLLPNILPLVMTAGLMGYFGIPIKTIHHIGI